ncbi:hypothetical protein HD597_003542 [Nonomuraea thailandensis]|uniref:Uncharacterized protein n=1 Tax=Nonomuraea thailandensis TaxID=1188745 RepID=A0A9X2GCZ9_9ACTN|nr:hypothetical protein [Nonomuraea thailandensis]MCP2356522.1 hypothetical protein [Nonomuraea thailandensis]
MTMYARNGRTKTPIRPIQVIAKSELWKLAEISSLAPVGHSTP